MEMLENVSSFVKTILTIALIISGVLVLQLFVYDVKNLVSIFVIFNEHFQNIHPLQFQGASVSNRFKNL